MFLIPIFILYLILNFFGIGCPIKWFTGISCPSCGMTRAVLSIMKFDFKMALYYHPLFWLIIPSVLFIIHAKKPIFGNKNYQLIFLAVLTAVIMTVYFIRLFDINNDIITIDLQNSQIVLLYKTIKEWFYD